MVEVITGDNVALAAALHELHAGAVCIAALAEQLLCPHAHWTLSRRSAEDIMSVLHRCKTQVSRAISDAESALNAP